MIPVRLVLINPELVLSLAVNVVATLPGNKTPPRSQGAACDMRKVQYRKVKIDDWYCICMDYYQIRLKTNQKAPICSWWVSDPTTRSIRGVSSCHTGRKILQIDNYGTPGDNPSVSFSRKRFLAAVILI